MYRKLPIILIGLLLNLSAWAFEDAKVEYSADMTMETAEQSLQGKIYHGTNMERRDMNADGEPMQMIVRHDKKLVYMLMPSEHLYMEMGIKEAAQSGDLSGYKMVEHSQVGQESVNGIAATKYKMIMQAPDGTKMGGFQWVSRDGITIKLDMIAVEKGEKMRMKMELSNLKVGKQERVKFEIPAGYSKMDMGGFGGMMGGFRP